jgi:hypothetical protein
MRSGRVGEARRIRSSAGSIAEVGTRGDGMDAERCGCFRTRIGGDKGGGGGKQTSSGVRYALPALLGEEESELWCW